MGEFTPCLCFDGQAEEAAKFYTSVFKNSRIKGVIHHGEAAAKAAGRPKGSVLAVIFELQGQEYTALNGGPSFKFSPAMSLMVHCETQEEVDEFWGKLSKGGEEGHCGWLTDQYGVSWQIVPAKWGEMLQDPGTSERVMGALLQMKKLDIKALERAYRQP